MTRSDFGRYPTILFSLVLLCCTTAWADADPATAAENAAPTSVELSPAAKAAAQPAFVEASIRSGPQLSYPLEARRKRIQANAVLELDIDAQGTLTNSRIARSTGNDELDAAALDWVSRIEFNPAKRDGEPIASVKPLMVTFKLNDEVDQAFPELPKNASPKVAMMGFNKYIAAKVKANGVYAMCGQKAYLKCHTIDYNRCVDELSTVREDCQRRAMEKFWNPADPEYPGKFVKFYTACMILRHVNMHISDVVEIQGCLAGAENNDKLFEADMLR